ncbi:MAG TPA: TIR domain-containing protein [Hungateiclostridium thermocellum]|uniref:TIR protein n=2 Tax=Acetivibrio thermocellus TaxID=1515 RepID=A3DFE7_ACET2|nr:trypsin-like peptidase domain-containing protein [Acetivibrio thermocellus]ABN52676.1 TIR protein [Acetivibrio thermocellus ATCC 27405]ADU73877.1 TIR protein [Acetivibrio thermocellus DSM 1313]ALX07814.1 TIR protein [Acetivibrio thermocellus AD2]ANV75556.1 TIR protein [Acetivibrio thermocellus DSM 2360]EIC03303.1 TIR protein [Acetivibrio thermocellus YS]
MIYFCHAPNDRAIAEKIYFSLKQTGLTCWIPSQDIMAGQYYVEAIANAIEKSDIVVFIFSSHSNTSIQVIDELQKASSLNKTIIPFCVDRAMPSEPIEHYLSSPYKVDATIGLPDDNIAKLQNIIKQIYNQSSVHNANDINTVKDTFAPSNPLENNTNIIKDASDNNSQESIQFNGVINSANSQPPQNPNLPPQHQMNPNFNNTVNNMDRNMNYPIKQNVRPNPQVKSSNKIKIPLIIGGSIAGGIILLSILFMLGKNLLFSTLINSHRPSDNPVIGSNIRIDGSKYTEEEIIEFTKNAILELDRLQASREFYDTYAYNAPEYDLMRIQENVFFSLMDLDVVRFEEVAILGKNEKEHGIEYLLKVDFVCYADYEYTENNETVHRKGEALLYNNVVILETPNDGLKYLYMEGIFEDELNARNENLESSYREIAESGDVNTEDTIQTYLPDSTDEDTIMSVKDIVKKNDHKVVAVYVDVPGGQSQGSGFFIKDGVIVTNYHVIEGGKSAKILLSNGNYVDVEGVLYTDSDVDIAVLKLVNEVGIEPVTIGQARDSDKGSIAVAIGSPLGLFNTVSTGIISNFWEANGVNLIQISIPITHGNSGGALFNESGKLIGITSSGIGEANLNFAISSTHIIPICEDIKNIPYNQLNAVPLSSAGGNINSITRQAGSSNSNQSSSSGKSLLSSKYRFVNSDKPISNDATYTSDLQTIYDLALNKYYAKEDLYRDLDYAFDYILDYGTKYYLEYLEYILHETYIKEDVENFNKINESVLEVLNTTGEYIEFTADEIEIIGAGIKNDGTIDGIIVRALFYENSEPYVRSKFYFRANYDAWSYVDGFLYVGEVTEK